MASQMAQILSQYRQTMPEAGAGLRKGMEGYVAGQQAQREAAVEAEQKGFERQLATSKEAREQAKEAREVTKAERERRAELLKKLAVPATAADTADKWLAAQESGFIPKDLTFDQREPTIMAAITEAERLAREKEARTSRQEERKLGIEEMKAKTAAGKERREAGGGREGLKATDERYLASRVAGLFEGTYDVQTGTLQIRDDRSRRLAQKIIADASRLAKHNQNMSLSMAVSEAAERNGVSVQDIEPAGGAPGGGAPAGGGMIDRGDPLGWRQ